MDGHTTKLATAVANRTDGIVKTITIETHGSGFIDDPMVDITSSPTRNVASGIALRGQMGSFLCITVPVSGAGYTEPPNVKIVGGGQSVTLTPDTTAVFENGCVTPVLLNNTGSGYTEAPTVTIESTNGVGSDTQAAATVILQTDFGDLLKTTFIGSFKDWDVSKDVIPSTDVTGDIKRQLEVKFLEEDVVGQGLAHVTLSFENGITISEYPQTYSLLQET